MPVSEASCRRLIDVAEILPGSPTTAVRMPLLKPSSMAQRMFLLQLARTTTSRSGPSPRAASPGPYRSRPRWHQSTVLEPPSIARPRRAAEKPVAAASDLRAMTSCSPASGSPPHGKAASILAMPKGKTVGEDCPGCRRSSLRMRRRRSSNKAGSVCFCCDVFELMFIVCSKLRQSDQDVNRRPLAPF